MSFKANIYGNLSGLRIVVQPWRRVSIVAVQAPLARRAATVALGAKVQRGAGRVWPQPQGLTRRHRPIGGYKSYGRAIGLIDEEICAESLDLCVEAP